MEQLNWLPIYIDKLMASSAWRELKDYQFGWYMRLLFHCTRSEPVGYLKVDGRLWVLAGAQSERFWESIDKTTGRPRKAAVLARFKTRQIDGQDFIYNQRMLTVLSEQVTKYERTRQGNSQIVKKPCDKEGEISSISLSSSSSKKSNSKSFTQHDFDARDMRKISAELGKLNQAVVGADVDADQLFNTACIRAGVEIEHGRKLFSICNEQNGTSWAWKHPNR